jgi:hypothetical protein
MRKQPVGQTDPITVDQARWFLSLPEKIRKQHFSREELLLLTQHSREVLQIVGQLETDEESTTCSSPTPSHPGSVLAQASVASSDFTEEAIFELSEVNYDRDDPAELPVVAELEAESIHLVELEGNSIHSGRTGATGEAHAEILTMYSNRRASIATTVSTSTIPPPPAYPQLEPIPPPEPHRRKKSLARVLALTPVALPPPTLSPAPPLPSPTTIRHFATGARPYTAPTPPLELPAPQARYYQDPEARKQLRTYLASPQKFDEALEFGFPSNGTNSVTPMSPNTEDGVFPIQRSTSQWSHESIEDDVSVDTHGPTTPTLVQDQTLAEAKAFESGMNLPIRVTTTAREISHSPSNSLERREMTIRMTLTRPELRTGSEEKLYSTQRTQNSGVEVAETDPLALDPLPVCDDPTGAHGAFAQLDAPPAKGFKKVFRKNVRRK